VVLGETPRGEAERCPFKEDLDGETRPFKEDLDGETRPFKEDLEGETRPFKEDLDGETRPFKEDLDGEAERCPFKEDLDGEAERCPFKEDLDGEAKRCPFKADLDGETRSGEIVLCLSTGETDRFALAFDLTGEGELSFSSAFTDLADERFTGLDGVLMVLVRVDLAGVLDDLLLLEGVGTVIKSISSGSSFLGVAVRRVYFLGVFF
jgi:hypothetical protein